MEQRSEYFEIIDRYLNNELTESERSELELKMEFNSDLFEELNLQLNVLNAVHERDIISLRKKMHTITHNHTIMNNDPSAPSSDNSDSFHFELAEELTASHNFNHQVKMEEINNLTHSFPKVHLYQHLVAAKENIYQFYKEQQEEHHAKKDQELFSALDDALFEDIKNALQENDLLDLRANLKQIAASLPSQNYSISDIHNYVDQTMDDEQRSRFEEKLNSQKCLATEVQFFKEVDLAIAEEDIMNLRNTLRNIHMSTDEFTYGIEEIDGYIYNELSEEEMALFENELANNKEFSSEIELIKNIDKALQEKDIMQLRANLRSIANQNIKENQVERSIGIKFKHRKIAISMVAASLILLMGVTGLFRYTADDNIYRNFYTRYETSGTTRSANATSDQTFALALQKYNSKDYQSALNLLQQVITKDDNNIASHFYSAVSLQELGKYKNAIKEYQVVVVDKDNLFIEQAEWYIGLCYLQTREDKKAINQFKKIIDGKGYYEQKASAILRKMKNNL